uniref:Protein kinase domain-containing protein n=1 Tax=Brassica campestris TaxID=3711 RepID=M4EL55_BRACM
MCCTNGSFFFLDIHKPMKNTWEGSKENRLLGNICAVTTANKAQTALELLRDNRNKFDLVISDLEMDLTVINHLEEEEDERGNENDDTTAHKNLVVNEKCDVYGFGVLILELLTGRRLLEYGEDSFVILSDHVRVLLEQGNVLECIDPTMEEEYSEDEVLPFLKLSLVCTSQIPSNLPTMAEIVQILQAISSPVPHRHRMLDSFSKSSVLI